MSTLAERLETATASIEVRDTKLFAIVEGAADDPDVSTEAGPVKPVAKVVAEGEALIAELVGSLETAVTSAAGSATTATEQAGIATTKAGIATTKAEQTTDDAEATAADRLQTGSDRTASANSATLAEDWATKTTGVVAASEYSSKEYALGTAVATGSAKQWAVKATSPDGTASKSAKTYSEDAGTYAGTATAKAGEAETARAAAVLAKESSEAAAEEAGEQAGIATTKAGEASGSATMSINSATLAGDWASKTTAAVSGGEFSAKEYAKGTQAATGGSAKNWAGQTGTDVTGASANDRSAKSWAQEDLHGATLGGSAKDWAQSAELPDGTNKSSKSYAVDAAASAVTAADSAALAQGIPFRNVITKSAGFTVAVADKGKIFDVTTAASTITATLPAAATAGDGWYIFLRKVDSGAGTVISSPVTKTLASNGALIVIWCNGTSYFNAVTPIIDTTNFGATIANGYVAVFKDTTPSALQPSFGALRVANGGGGGNTQLTLGNRDSVSSSAVTIAAGNGGSGPNSSMTASTTNGIWSASGNLSVGGSETTFTSIPYVPLTSSTFGRTACLVYSSVTPVGNVGTGEDNLISQTIAASFLTANSSRIRARQVFIFAANANAKTVKIKFGATSITVANALILNGGSLIVETVITRLTATTQNIEASWHTDNATLGCGATFTTAAETLTGSVTFKATGEATNDDDIVEKCHSIEFLPAP